MVNEMASIDTRGSKKSPLIHIWRQIFQFNYKWKLLRCVKKKAAHGIYWYWTFSTLYKNFISRTRESSNVSGSFCHLIFFCRLCKNYYLNLKTSRFIFWQNQNDLMVHGWWQWDTPHVFYHGKNIVLRKKWTK